MRIKDVCLGTAAAALLTLSVASARAASLSVPGSSSLTAEGQNASPLQQAAYRRCWIRYGVRHCRWVGYYDDYGYYDYGGPYYEYGPGIGFFFGGGGGHFHGGHFHGGHHR
jgi:hypothetical protein